MYKKPFFSVFFAGVIFSTASADELFLITASPQYFESVHKEMADVSSIERTVGEIYTKGFSHSKGTLSVAPLTSSEGIAFQLLFPSRTTLSTQSATISESGLLAKFLKGQGKSVPKDVGILFSVDPSVEAFTSKSVLLTSDGFRSHPSKTQARASVSTPQSVVIQTQGVLPRNRFETVVTADGHQETHKVGGLGVTVFPRLRNRFGSQYQSQAPLMPIEPVLIPGTARIIAKKAPEKFFEKFESEKNSSVASLEDETTRTLNAKFDKEFETILSEKLEKNFHEFFITPLTGNGEDSFLGNGHLEMASHEVHGIAIRGANGAKSALDFNVIAQSAQFPVSSFPLSLKLHKEFLENIFRIRLSNTKLTDRAIGEMFGQEIPEPKTLSDLVGSPEDLTLTFDDKSPIKLDFENDQIVFSLHCKTLNTLNKTLEDVTLKKIFNIVRENEKSLFLKQAQFGGVLAKGRAIDKDIETHIQNRILKYFHTDSIDLSGKVFFKKLSPLSIQFFSAKKGNLFIGFSETSRKELP